MRLVTDLSYAMRQPSRRGSASLRRPWHFTNESTAYMARKSSAPRTPPTTPVKRPQSRPTKLTAAVSQAILNAVAGGVPYLRAASLAGIGADTAMEWRRRGEKTDRRPTTPLYASFAKALARAIAQDEARRVLRINQAGQGGTVIYEKTITHADGHVTQEVKRSVPDWRADAFHLERTQPDIWGPKERVDVRITMIQQAAAKGAEELGMTAEEVILEAQGLLRELDHA